MACVARMEDCEVVGIECHLVGMICWCDVSRIAGR